LQQVSPVQSFEPLVAIDLEPVDWHAIRLAPLPAPPGARLVTAQTDTALARAFLHANALSPHSLKSTAKDLGRFLLWCQTQDKMLTELRVEDLLAYKVFLVDPQPASRWISATKWPRTDSRWRPFSGPLAPVSVAHAFRVAKALLEFASDTGYVQRNAGALVKNLRAPAQARESRFLSDRAIAHVHSALEALPTTTRSERRAQARDRFLFVAYLTTGARLSEITGATMGAIYAEADARWWLDVLGKGGKPRRLPVSPALLDALRHYRRRYGLAPETTRDDPLPLILATRGTAFIGVTDEAVSKAIKRLFLAAARRAQACGEADCAVSLRLASTHWLRHTMLTNQANNNVSLKALQDTAGHANIATTARYLHKSDQERHDEIMGSLAKKTEKPDR
jgi:integrase/recombinase XerD